MPPRGPFNSYPELEEQTEDGAEVKQLFARNLQAHLNARGWNQSELARRAEAHLPKPAKGQKQSLHFGRDRISYYIRGKVLPRGPALKALAAALGCAASDLLPPTAVRRPGQPRPAAFAVTQIGDDMLVEMRRLVSPATFRKLMDLIEEDDKARKSEAAAS